MIRSRLLLVVILLSAPGVARADLPSWLRKQNGDVSDGNELLQKGDAKGALAAYDRAARELPDNAGVQLDRGLALLKLGELAKAKEALLSAAGPAGPTDTRADAYRNLSLAYYRDADALAGQNKHDEAQKMFRDSVDAAKRSLRLRPGDPNAAWNLELATRRVREEEAKQKAEEEEKKKQEEKNKDDSGDPQKQDGDKQDGDKQDGDKQDGDKQDGDKQDGDKQDGKDQPQKSPEQEKAEKEAQKQAQAKQDAANKQAQKDAEAGKEDSAQADKPLPADVAHALDALQDGEENFERVRARQRAGQERRAPEKDW